MRLLCDENIPGPIVTRLRARGHDVLWINDGRRGAKDDLVAQLARTEHRTLVTLDKDFRFWALRSDESLPDGLVLVQIESRDYAFVCDRVIQAIEQVDDWSNILGVVLDTRLKLRYIRPPAIPDAGDLESTGTPPSS